MTADHEVLAFEEVIHLLASFMAYKIKQTEHDEVITCFYDPDLRIDGNVGVY